MDHPSPARAFSALSSSVVSAGRVAGRVASRVAGRAAGQFAAGAAQRLGLMRINDVRSAAARVGAAAARAASGALAAFDTAAVPAAGAAPSRPFEALEGRRMLSSVTLSNGILS